MTAELELADDVFESIHAVMHLYRSQQYRVLRDGPCDLTHMENKVLGFFARHPGATQSDLVQRTGRDKAQLARLIKGLRDKGLLTGEADALDRRSIRLRLTQTGESLHAQVREQGRYLTGIAVEGLSEAERAQLLVLLGRIGDNLRKAP